MNRLPSPWTPHRMKMLKYLWPTELSAAQIAVQIGVVTRNAVIGKARRLGLSLKVKPLKVITDEARLRKLWLSPFVRLTHICHVFGCGASTVYAKAHEMRLGQRPKYIGPKTVAQTVERMIPVKAQSEIIGCKCVAQFCRCLAVPGAMVCYAHGSGEVRV